MTFSRRRIAAGLVGFGALAGLVLVTLPVIPVPESTHAVWTIDGPVAREASRVTVQVTGTTCHDGQPFEPDGVSVREEDARVILLASVRGERMTLRGVAHTCPGSPSTPVEVKLPQPLGARALVDGACLPGGPAVHTGHCLDGGVRLGAS